ncbi:hypothetical protein [Aquipuribacter nitratireducens]|uniref:Aromatic acid exporter family protein n=1 Tax=Aquipuribacter nitratireducens TaxID=650104 RepID=A0ABW0GSK2_9MICO
MTFLGRHRTRLAIAGRSALAAFLAWHAAGLVPGVEDYRYYAPLGAAIVTYPTVADTVSSSWRALLAILAGGAIGAVVVLLPDAAGVPVGLAVGVGSLLAGLRAFGAQRAWVPTAALFTLVVGSGDPVAYLAAYAGLVLLGAGVGVAVTLLLPSLPRGQAGSAERRALGEVAVLLEDLAEAVETGAAEESVPDRREAVRSALAEARAGESETERARRGNLRARRHVEELGEEARALQVVDRVGRVALDLADALGSTDDLAALASDSCSAGGRVSVALRAVGRVLDPEPSGTPAEKLRDRAGRAVDELAGREADAACRDVVAQVVGHLRRLLVVTGPPVR